MSPSAKQGYDMGFDHARQGKRKLNVQHFLKGLSQSANPIADPNQFEDYYHQGYNEGLKMNKRWS